MATRQATPRLSLRKKFPSEYSSWRSAKARCYQASNASYKYVGGRGLGMCDRWRTSFAAFLEDMGPKPTPAHSIDRIDGSRGYDPSNCRWATDGDQQHNTSKCRFLHHDGRCMTIDEWSREVGISHSAIVYRLDVLGWEPSQAITAPTKNRGRAGIVILKFRGENRSLPDWSRVLGIPASTIRERLFKLNWTVERALSVHRHYPESCPESSVAQPALAVKVTDAQNRREDGMSHPAQNEAPVAQLDRAMAYGAKSSMEHTGAANPIS